jgi:hypothetical protein
MVGGIKKRFVLIFMVIFSLSLVSVNADLDIVNSRDWADVYSVMLHSSFKSQQTTFLNTESLGVLTKFFNSRTPLQIYESNNPYIRNLGAQLTATGYNVKNEYNSKDFSIELDIQSGNYIVISQDNPRVSIPVIPLAQKTNSWVLIVSPDNLDQVEDKLKNSLNVIAVGNFPRDVLEKIEPHFDERINTNDIFQDSQAIALKIGDMDNVLLVDGNFIENEFFTSRVPIILSGTNRVLKGTLDFMIENNVKSIIIVGNELAVVGEQIRSGSNKKISVFIKFGQSDVEGTGKVYSLTYFPFPSDVLSLTITEAIYDFENKQLAVYFKNLGTTGLFFLNTLSVENRDETKLGSVTDSDVRYLGSNEVLPVIYDLDLPLNEINNETIVKFYTSFGITPTGLDNFLTMDNKYGPPFTLKLDLGELAQDDSEIEVISLVYYKSYNRLGVKVNNLKENPVFYRIKIPSIIVNGVEQNFDKQDSVEGLSEKITYLNVKLDSIDIIENSKVDLVVQYGESEEILLKTLPTTFELGVKGGIPIVLIVIVGIVIVAIAILALFVFNNQ